MMLQKRIYHFIMIIPFMMLLLFSGTSKSIANVEVQTATPAGTVHQHDAKADANQLKAHFVDLVKFVAKEIEVVNVFWLCLEIENFFKIAEAGMSAGEVHFQEHLIKLQDYKSPNSILNHLVRHNFLGYNNYSLIKVFQKVTKSQLLDKRIEEYEKAYKIFLVRNFRDIKNVLQQCPDLFQEYPVGIPKFKIHLKSEWEGESVFVLGDYTKLCRLNPHAIDQLTIDKIIIDYS